MNAERESVKTGQRGQRGQPRFDGHKLRRLRLQRRMSGAELARQVGCDRSSITRFEAGTIGPSLGTVASLAEVLGVPLTDLMTSGDGEAAL